MRQATKELSFDGIAYQGVSRRAFLLSTAGMAIGVAFVGPLGLREALGSSRVEPFSEAEWDQVCADTELGHVLSFENPFGAGVFFDELLQSFPNLVFCPRMFCGERGLCFRVPTQEFLDLTHALVLPLTAQACYRADDWAV